MSKQLMSSPIDSALPSAVDTPTSWRTEGLEAEKPKLLQNPVRKNEDLLKAVLTPRDKRTPQQVMKLSAWLSTVPGHEGLTPPVLHSLVQHLYGAEVHAGQAVYHAGDPSDWCYMLVEGNITIVDNREPDEPSDPVVAVLTAGSTFGYDEILSCTRRVFNAIAHDGAAILLRLPIVEYRKSLEDLHQGEFEKKVAFLASLAPIKPLKEEVIRKLAPCFQLVEFAKGDVVVRQGDKADAMYAIQSGVCNVLVDPHYQETSEGLGELDPKKTVQIVTLQSSAIIGDVTVLAKLRKRTASVVAQTEVCCYKIRRSTFLRRLPADQLDILKRLASEKLKLMEKKVAARPASKGLQNQILQGHNLRQLLYQQAQHTGYGAEQPTEYQQLIHVLRRYKRPAAPRWAVAPAGAPNAFMANEETSNQVVSGTKKARDRKGATTLAAALKATLNTRATSRVNIIQLPGRSRDMPPSPLEMVHQDWQKRTHRSAVLADGSAAMASMLRNVLSPARRARSMAGCAIASDAPYGNSAPSTPSLNSTRWRPLSPRWLSNEASGHPSKEGPFDYHARPFVASVTLRTLAKSPAIMAEGSDDNLTTAYIHSQPNSPVLLSPSGDSNRYTQSTSALPSLQVPDSPLCSPTTQSRPGSGWSSARLWQKQPPRTPNTPPLTHNGDLVTGGSSPNVTANEPPQLLALDFHTDLEAMMKPSKSTGDLLKEPSELEAVLDSLSRPLLAQKPNPGMFKRGVQNYRPSIPKAVL